MYFDEMAPFQAQKSRLDLLYMRTYSNWKIKFTIRKFNLG